MYRILCVAALAATLAGCATAYQPNGLTGGFDAKELREDVYRVTFGGNGYTTGETAQTYWLFQCAELTLSKGYYGFEILSDMKFSRRDQDDADRQWMRRTLAALDPMVIPLRPNELARATRLSDDRLAASTATATLPGVRVARFSPVFVYVPAGGGPPKPAFEGDIHLIKQPFEPAPPKRFAAARPKAALEPLVTAEKKCNMGNICPHVHEYLLPKGTLQPR